MKQYYLDSMGNRVPFRHSRTINTNQTIARQLRWAILYTCSGSVRNLDQYPTSLIVSSACSSGRKISNLGTARVCIWHYVTVCRRWSRYWRKYQSSLEFSHSSRFFRSQCAELLYWPFCSFWFISAATFAKFGSNSQNILQRLGNDLNSVMFTDGSIPWLHRLSERQFSTFTFVSHDRGFHRYWWRSCTFPISECLLHFIISSTSGSLWRCASLDSVRRRRYHRGLLPYNAISLPPA